MEKPVSEHTLPQGGPTVATFGGGLRAFEHALAYIKANGREADALISPPSGPQMSGFKEVRRMTSTFELVADGLIVRPERAVLIYSRDCPIVTFASRRNPTVIVCHAGRPALDRTLGPAESVIDRALPLIESNRLFRHYVNVHIAAAICQSCFEHRGPGAEAHIKFFRQHFPETVRGIDGKLDLPRVVALQCQERGVPLENISHDGICTREHPALASHRNGDQRSNITVVLT